LSLRTIQVPLPSGVVVPDNRVNLLLPQGYQEHPNLAYPVLYLLHGAGDSYASWAERTDLVELAGAFPLIIAMPDAGCRSRATWYSDWAEGSYQMETFLVSVLPGHLRRHYRVLEGSEAVAGLSMGGFGALSLAARHPGRFRAAAAYSGVLDTLWGAPESGELFSALNAEYGTPDARVWGEQSAARATWAAHNPTSLVERLRDVELFVSCGNGQPGGFAGDVADDASAYVMEAGLRDLNLSFLAAAEAAGLSCQTDLYPGGYHGWAYWQAANRWALPQVAAILGPPRPIGGRGLPGEE
jgi:diacylglycerol O-acyltransferase/trehalose O-mycolyltransferase